MTMYFHPPNEEIVFCFYNCPGDIEKKNLVRFQFFSCYQIKKGNQVMDFLKLRLRNIRHSLSSTEVTQEKLKSDKNKQQQQAQSLKKMLFSFVCLFPGVTIFQNIILRIYHATLKKVISLIGEVYFVSRLYITLSCNRCSVGPSRVSSRYPHQFHESEIQK